MSRLPGAEQTTRCVLLADRHHNLTEAVRGLLETAFDTVVMVADEASLLDGAARLRPEVAIVDLSLARDRSLEWLRELKRRCPELAVVALSVHDEPSVRRAATAAGADGFVLKREIVTELLPVLERVRGRASTSTPARGAPTEPGRG